TISAASGTSLISFPKAPPAGSRCTSTRDTAATKRTCPRSELLPVPGQTQLFGDVGSVSGLPKSGHDWAIYEYTPELDAARRCPPLSRESSTAQRAPRRCWRGWWQRGDRHAPAAACPHRCERAPPPPRRR